MRTSREVKLLAAIFLLALATWIWAETGERQQLALGSPLLVSAQGLPEAPAPAPATDDLEDAPEVARDIRIARLPFLVTEEPVFEQPDPEAPASPAARPAGQITINPFAPIATPTAPTTTPAPAATTPAPTPPTPAATPPGAVPVVVDVAPRPDTAAPGAAVPGTTIPGAAVPGAAAGEITPALPAAPAPSALTPSAPAISRLPRALPSGTLPISPPPLRTPRPELSASVAEAPVAPIVTERVISQVPQQATAPAPDIPPATPELASPAATAEVAPLPLWRPSAESAPAPAAVNGMSGVLAQENIVFTGAVLGPVSVGIFRMSGGTAVVPLGQTLPNTEIVLTDVSGQSAELTLGDQKEILTIDTGR